MDYRSGYVSQSFFTFSWVTFHILTMYTFKRTTITEVSIMPLWRLKCLSLRRSTHNLDPSWCSDHPWGGALAVRVFWQRALPTWCPRRPTTRFVNGEVAVLKLSERYAAVFCHLQVQKIICMALSIPRHGWKDTDDVKRFYYSFNKAHVDCNDWRTRCLCHGLQSAEWGLLVWTTPLATLKPLQALTFLDTLGTFIISIFQAVWMHRVRCRSEVPLITLSNFWCVPVVSALKMPNRTTVADIAPLVWFDGPEPGKVILSKQLDRFTLAWEIYTFFKMQNWRPCLK